jgi:hypothetical protein
MADKMKARVFVGNKRAPPPANDDMRKWPECRNASGKRRTILVSLHQQLSAGMSCIVIEVDGKVRRVELGSDSVRAIDNLRELIGGYIRMLVLKGRLRLVACHRASLKTGSTTKNEVAERLSNIAHFGGLGVRSTGIMGRAAIISVDAAGAIESVGDDVESTAREVAEEIAIKYRYGQ